MGAMGRVLGTEDRENRETPDQVGYCPGGGPAAPGGTPPPCCCCIICCCICIWRTTASDMKSTSSTSNTNIECAGIGPIALSPLPRLGLSQKRYLAPLVISFSPSERP